MITEESFLDFRCPACNEPASFPQNQAGLLESCPNCPESFIVPQPGVEVASPIPIPIKTGRLVLRRFNPQDWKDLLEFMSDEELFQFMEGHPMDEEAVLAWLERDRYVRITTTEQTFNLGIELQEQKKIIGFVGLNFFDAERRQANVTPWVSRKYQRQGIGLEAVEGVLGFCFEGISLHRVAGSADTRNTAALRLFEKLGLRLEGEFVKDRLVKNEWASTKHYAALREEWVD